MALKAKYKAAIQLIRFELAFAAGLCVVFGGIVASHSIIPSPSVILGFFCGFLVSGSANILNDYFDFEVDLMNAPDRPLPSGKISKFEVLIYAIFTALTGLLISLILGYAVFVFCCSICLLSFLYNWKLKEMGVLGNLVVATLVASTFLLGALIVGKIWSANVWLLSAIAFFIDLGEEIAGDAMDIEGDKIRQTNSIAIKYGKRVALRISLVSFLVVIIISVIPLFLNLFSFKYAISLIIVDIFILLFAIKLLKSQTRAKGLMFMRAIYTIGYLGLAVVYILAFTEKV